MAYSPKYGSVLVYFKDGIFLNYFTLSISNSLNLENIIVLSLLSIRHFG